MNQIDAMKIAGRLINMMKPHCDRIDVAGSIRRQVENVKDIEIVAIPKVVRRPAQDNLFGEEKDFYPLHEWATRQPRPVAWIKPGVSEIIPWEVKPDGKYWRGLVALDGRPFVDAREAVSRKTVKLDLFLCKPENWGCIYTIRTGSAEFSTRLVTHLRDNTIYIHDQGGLYRKLDGLFIPCPEEKHLFARAGVEYVIPRLRTGPRAVKPRFNCGPHGCDHTTDEHKAFDAGVSSGELGEGEDANPYPVGDGEGFWFDWLTGHSVGTMNRQVEADK